MRNTPEEMQRLDDERDMHDHIMQVKYPELHEQGFKGSEFDYKKPDKPADNIIEIMYQLSEKPETEGFCMTPCSMRKHKTASGSIGVGSISCGECPQNRGVDKKNKTVKCYVGNEEDS